MIVGILGILPPLIGRKYILIFCFYFITTSTIFKQGTSSKLMESIHHYFDRRYIKNKYAGTGHENVEDANLKSPQYPKRMYRPKKQQQQKGVKNVDYLDTENITEESFDLLLMTPEQRKSYLAKKEQDNEYLKGMELESRHRYGDDIDILRATFTKSKEEVEHEKFQLILACRDLYETLFNSCKLAPKCEKYVLGSLIRESAQKILATSVRLKKRYYRKNMLEDIDIELEVQREWYLEAHKTYPEWIDSQQLSTVYQAINRVGAIVGGLLKTTVV